MFDRIDRKRRQDSEFIRSAYTIERLKRGCYVLVLSSRDTIQDTFLIQQGRQLGSSIGLRLLDPTISPKRGRRTVALEVNLGQQQSFFDLTRSNRSSQQSSISDHV